MGGGARSGRRGRAIAVLVGIGALLAPGSAAPQGEIVARFRDAIAVEVASVDVVVEDRTGRPALGLAREDFTLLVDGRPVELTHFAAYRIEAAEPAPVGRPAPSVESGEGASVPAPAETPPPATWVVYVDSSRLGHFARVEAMRQTRRFLARAARAGEGVLVVSFDTRSLRVHGALDDAATAGRKLEELERRAVAPDRGAPPNATPVELTTSDRELLLQMQLSAFRDLLSIVEALEGRVALLMVGGGFDTSDVEEDRRTRFFDDYRRLVERANTGRLTVYSIYSGAGRFPPVRADNEMTTELRLQANLAYVSDELTPEGSSTIAGLARATGGLAFVSSPDLAVSLQRVRGDLDAYYSLGYRPPASGSAAVQRLEVRVRDGRLRVRHRTALRGRSQEQHAERQTLAALLAAAPPPNPLGVAVEVGEATAAQVGRALRVPVELRVPIGALTLLEQGERHLGRLAFQFVVEEPDGGYRRLEPRELPLEIPSAQLATARAQSLGYSIELKLPKGSYRLAVTVSDMVGGVHSTLTTPVEAQKPRARARRAPAPGASPGLPDG